ncbi:MAG TPA: hypothetical protein PKC76_05140 [Saprospiraceae bacterium]|nr:hypothetical protein [Saprospiraceae bacterium]HMP23493.1 hypothetical protein [Saprospiraceae bacterium]
MKIAQAWLLLFVLMSNWIGGLLCFEASYYIESRREMSAQEKEIAAAIQQQTGVVNSVRIEEEIIPRGHIYSDFFLFSTEIEQDQTIYYTLETEAQATSLEKMTEPQERPLSDNEKSLLLKSLSYEFIMTHPNILPFFEASTERTPMLVAFCLSQCEPALLTPPPDDFWS